MAKRVAGEAPSALADFWQLAQKLRTQAGAIRAAASTQRQDAQRDAGRRRLSLDEMLTPHEFSKEDGIHAAKLQRRLLQIDRHAERATVWDAAADAAESLAATIQMETNDETAELIFERLVSFARCCEATRKK